MRERERVREKEIKGDRERHRKNERKLRDRFFNLET